MFVGISYVRVVSSHIITFFILAFSLTASSISFTPSIIYSLLSKLMGNAVDGWTFLSCSIWFATGIQMLSLGIIGEYIGKSYNETKRRPRYIISEDLSKNV